MSITTKWLWLGKFSHGQLRALLAALGYDEDAQASSLSDTEIEIGG